MKALSGGFRVLRPEDPSSRPCATSLCSCITSLIFFQHCHADNADNTQHNSTSLPLLSPPMSPIFNTMSHCCLKFNLDKAAVLLLQVISPFYFPLWNYIVSFVNVWVLHNAACTAGKLISDCLFKWQLYPQGLPALCMFWLCSLVLM